MKDEALLYLKNGLSVLPAKRAKKCPVIGSWKIYQNRLPSQVEVETWFSSEHDALCIVCGKVSGNLEILDFDHKGELFPVWKAKIAPELLARLVIEQTPSGGYHVAYRAESPVCGNVKLAQGKRENDKNTTLIETRGEGGLVLCAPSDGYTLIQNNFEQLPTITDDEREDLLSAAYELNEVQVEPPKDPIPVGDMGNFAIRPGDDYNSRGDFRSLLVKHGWTPMHKSGENEYFRRPGKNIGGQSASFNGKVFYVFSSNAAPFEPGAYSPFNAYTILEHGGDFTAAANKLISEGFGSPAEVTGVDISGIVNQGQKAERSPQKKENLFPDPGAFPEHLFHVPGFMEEYLNLSEQTAYYPNKILAIGGGLALLSLFIGRVYKNARGTHPNLYWVSLADSGTGKEHARQVNKFLAFKAGMPELIGDSFASGEGLEDAMFATRKKLFMLDEMDTLLNSMKQKDPRGESIMQRLLTFYGAANSFYIMRAKARQKGESFGGYIINPYLVLYGTALPKYFYGALEERVLENGLIPRTLIADAGERGDSSDNPKDMFLTPQLAEMLNVLKKKITAGGNLACENPDIQIVQETDEAREAQRACQLYCDEQSTFFHKKNEQAAYVLWNRANEKINKLALIYAASANIYDPKITVDAVNWARDLVYYLTRKMLYMADCFSYVDIFDRDCKKAIRILQDCGGVCRHSTLAKKMKRQADQFKRLMDTLMEREEVSYEIITDNGGRPGRYYRYIGAHAVGTEGGQKEL